MPGKKAKKGGKSRKNDPEWRLLHEQETRKRREELLETFMKDKLSKESVISRLNSIKLSWQWRNLLRDIKTKELIAETEILKESFEHLLQTKNRIIDKLIEEIEESDKQQTEAIESHMESCTTILEIQQAHLDRMQNSYEIQKEKIVEMLRQEEAESREKHIGALQELNRMENNFTEKHDDLKNTILTEYQSRKDELLNKSLEEQHALKVQLNIAVEGLWQQFQQLLRNFHENTKEKKKSFYELKAKDEKNGLEIELQNKKLMKLEESVTKLKKRLHCFAGEEMDYCGTQQMEQEEFRGELNRLRDKIKTEKEENEKRLVHLTMSSHKAIEYLEKTIWKGNQILKAEHICRKYSHPDMALHVPPGDSGYQAKILEKFGKQEKFSKTLPMVKPPTDETLENFWRNYNEVFLETCFRKEENKILLEENAKLQLVLKEYLNRLANGGMMATDGATFATLPRSLPMLEKRIKAPKQALVPSVHIVESIVN